MKSRFQRRILRRCPGIGMSSYLCCLARAQPKSVTLEVAPNGRYLQRSDGVPFFVQSDTAWTLSRDYSREEVAKYLESRRALKFNTIQMSAVFFVTPAMEAQIGEAFTDGDFAKPVATHRDKVDWTVREATRPGFVVALNPIWGNQRKKPIKKNGVEKCRDLGRRLARRCRDNPGARD